MWDPSTWWLPSVASIDHHASEISRWRYGTVLLRNGKLIAIQARWWPRWGTVFGAMMDRVVRTLPEDECRFYFAFPRSAPGFMSLLYVHAGEKTTYQTFHQGIASIEAIARLRRSHAIVCQVTNDRLSERMMNRWGYVKHAPHLGPDHYICRLQSVD